MTQLATFTEQLAGKERISYEEFLRLTDGMHAEWVDGEVIPGVTISLTHEMTHNSLHPILSAFVDERSLGIVVRDPFQMKTGPGLPGRAPDLTFVANEHLDRLHETYLEGPADLAVEILSPRNASTDYVDKYREYESGGVPEYWIIDPVNHTADFFVLRDGRYERAYADAEGIYRSTAVPGFWFRVGWLWERPPLSKVLSEILAAPAP
ncbi:MAG: Uma2 family endonuclease [Dehalococcoidia bacterium]